ncbi:MAG: MFS transporter, partial [Alphaproteobacteria bacterium]|nr:MFS transporter [Alphaproteobacteria bacterium]
VTAVDRAAPRLARTAANLARVHLAADCVVADVGAWRPAAPFAAVLLDAPCSGTGIIRRHPDIAHLKTPADVVRLAGVQDRLLAAAARLVAPGGVLVYSVCSLEREEGPDRIAAFLAADAGFERLVVPGSAIAALPGAVTPEGDVRTLPYHRAAEGGMDGFFIARLRRRG